MQLYEPTIRLSFLACRSLFLLCYMFTYMFSLERWKIHLLKVPEIIDLLINMF